MNENNNIETKAQKTGAGKNKKMVIAAACAVLLVLAAILVWTGRGSGKAVELKETGLARLRKGDAASIQRTEDRGQKLVLSSDMINGSINPAFALVKADKAACELIFEPLFVQQDDGTLVPVLAQSAEWSEDKLSVTVKLKQGLVFSDNSPVTAKDACASIGIMSVAKYMNEVDESYYHIEGVSAYNEQQSPYIAGLTVVDDTTFQIRFADACSLNRRVLTTQVQKGLFAEFSEEGMTFLDIEAYSNRGIGTGPYTVGSTSTTNISLTANEFYRGEIKDFKAVEFHYVNFYDTADAIDNNRLDVIQYTAAAEQFERLYEAKQYSVYERPSELMYAIGFNMNNAFLQNEKVRLAIAHAFQTDKALSGEWGARIAATNVIGDGVNDAQQLEVNAVSYDKAKAKRLLEESDAAGKFSLRLPVLETNQFQQHIADSIKKDLEEVGISVEVVVCDDSEYMKTLYVDENFDLYLYSDEMPYDYNTFVQTIMPRDGMNVGCEDESYVSLVYGLRDAVTDEAYQAALLAVSNAFYEKVPLIPYGRVRTYVSVLADLDGIKGKTKYLPIGQLHEITVGK